MEISRGLSIILLMLAANNSVRATTIDERLATYQGKPADAVIADFGEPTSANATQLEYLFHGRSYVGHLGPPSPLDDLTRGSGLAPYAPSLGHFKIPCSLYFELDKTATVTAISHHGPGCFEVVFSYVKP